MKAETRQIPQKLAARLKFVYCIFLSVAYNILLCWYMCQLLFKNKGTTWRRCYGHICVGEAMCKWPACWNTRKKPRGDHYTWKGEAVGDAYTFLKMSKLICLRWAAHPPPLLCDVARPSTHRYIWATTWGWHDRQPWSAACLWEGHSTSNHALASWRIRVWGSRIPPTVKARWRRVGTTWFPNMGVSGRFLLRLCRSFALGPPMPLIIHAGGQVRWGVKRSVLRITLSRP